MAVVRVRKMEGRKRVRCIVVMEPRRCSLWSYCRALMMAIENAENGKPREIKKCN